MSRPASGITLNVVTIRFAISALAAIAIMLASASTHGTEVAGRFSLLADPPAGDTCRLRSGLENDGTVVVRDGCILLDLPALAKFSELREPLAASLQQTTEDTTRADATGTGAYALSRSWTAAIGYHHELLFPTASNEDLRTRRFSLFSADENRDVLDLHLSWRVSRLNELNLGYQVQANRASLAAAAESYSVRRFVSEADLDHAVTIGITRHFGNTD